MDAAKQAVKDFMGRSGHHDTTVHEKVAPAVTHETVSRREHEDVQTAIDKEVHQDHYHTSVQPVHDKAVLPETHHHNVIPIEHRNFEHDRAQDVEQRVAAEAGRFRDERVEAEGKSTSAVAPVVAGEHIHHHVHETIQPVVQKQTIEPHVVHTTVPIHEVHHNASQHHATSALPAVSMAEFKQQGGSLVGREERYDGFQGEPRAIGGMGEPHHHHGHHHGTTDRTGLSDTTGTTDRTGLSDTTGTAGRTGLSDTTGTAGRTGLSDTTSTTGRGGLSDTTGTTGGVSGSQMGASGLNSGSTNTQGTNLHSTGNDGHHFGTMDPNYHDAHDSAASRTAGGSSTTQSKPSMMDRLNPKKDADGDGKAGFMS